MSWRTITERGGFDVAVVGIPKSGTNCAEKVCKLLGVKPSHHMHTPFQQKIYDNYKVLYVVRNPRNVLVSWIRYTEEKVTEQLMIDRIADFKYPSEDGIHGPSLFEMYLSYNLWRWYPEVCTVVYEEMASGKVDNIADYLNVPRRDDITHILPGGTPTWNEEKSNWKDYWTDKIDRVWNNHNMTVIEKELHYA